MDKPKLDRVDASVVKKWCKHFKLAVDVEDDLEGAVIALSDAMKGKKLGGCSECGGDSDITLPECPFCGDAETELTATVSTAIKNIEKPKATKPKKAKPAPESEPEPEVVEKPKAVKPKKAKPEPEPEVVEKPKAAKAGKVVAKSVESEPEKPKPFLAKAKGQLATMQQATVTVIASAELTVGMSRVREAQVRGVECMWDLGHALFQIYEAKLYTQLTKGNDGTPVYDSWTKFCRKEFGIDPRYGFKLMDVSASFTKEQVSRIGVSKLTMLVRVPEEKREELMARAADTPKSKVAEEVAKLAGGTVRETGRNGFKGKRDDRTTKPPRKSEKLTVVRAQPSIVVDLFKRGKSERARSVDDAMGVEACANGMMVYYTIIKTEEGLALRIETRRE